MGVLLLCKWLYYCSKCNWGSTGKPDLILASTIRLRSSNCHVSLYMFEWQTTHLCVTSDLENVCDMQSLCSLFSASEKQACFSKCDCKILFCKFHYNTNEMYCHVKTLHEYLPPPPSSNNCKIIFSPQILLIYQ